MMVNVTSARRQGSTTTLKLLNLGWVVETAIRNLLDHCNRRSFHIHNYQQCFWHFWFEETICT